MKRFLINIAPTFSWIAPTAVTTAVALIGACGSGSGGREISDGGVGVDGGGEPDGGVKRDGGDDELPIFAVSDCGSLTVETLSTSSDVDAPTSFSEGTVVEARIDPDTVSNNTHVWRVNLPRGKYHLVVDSERTDQRNSNLGLELVEIVGDGLEGDRIIRTNEADRRMRVHSWLEVDSEKMFTFVVRPVHGAEDYHFGIFKNGTSVPSPFFTDCPTVTPVALGEKTDFPLPKEDDVGDEVWFGAPLELGDYQFTVDATQVIGSSNIIYSIMSLDQFGQYSRYKNVLQVNEVGVSHRAQDVLNVGEDSYHWIRVRNEDDDALNLSQTIEKQ